MKREDGTFIVGIDLGTTYSLVATIDNGRPVVIPNAVAENLTPSAVSVDGDGTVLVGAAARARAGRHPDRTALSFKRDMGTARTYGLGSERFTPIELSALVLSSLKADAEAALGGPIGEAVITVPAYFGEEQRRATLEASRLAGIHAERLINEPTAAALSYGFQRRQGESLVLVLDLGGGTFDVTVLRLIDGIIEILASAGDTQLGGDDFTRALGGVIREGYLGKEALVHEAELFDLAERAKRFLSAHLSVDLAVKTEDNHLRQITVSRVAAEAAWQQLLGRLAGPIDQALRDARIAANQIEDVLLVGGATRMPIFRSMAERRFGRAPLQGVPADEAVALGAAVQAALIVGNESVEDIVATDIAPFSLGIRSSEYLRGRFIHDLYTPILERGTVLPASRSKIFSTIDPSQKEIHVEIYQGEHPIAQRNTRIGVLEISDLPAGEINSVEIRLTYDLSGVLEVETTALATGAVKSAVFERGRGTLNEEERSEIRKRFARLKIHPRALLPNRVALERAEEIYARLLGEEREAVGHALAALRLALEINEDVEQARQALVRLVGVLAER